LREVLLGERGAAGDLEEERTVAAAVEPPVDREVLAVDDRVGAVTNGTKSRGDLLRVQSWRRSLAGPTRVVRSKPLGRRGQAGAARSVASAAREGEGLNPRR
jgi:hypothetical protein